MINLRRYLLHLIYPLALVVFTYAFSYRATAQSFGVAQDLFNGLGTNDFEYPLGASFTNNAATTNKTINNFTTGTLPNGTGQRLRAFLLPPTTGKYTFWISSDDWSDLYLSTDETAEHRTRIAYVSSKSNPKSFEEVPSQKSAPITLEGGRRYYIEALHRQASGVSHLDVRWQLPDDSIEEPINSRPAGKSERLIPYRTNTIVAPAFLKQPVNFSVLAGRPAVFSLLISNQAPVSYQWQKSGVDIPGETQPSLLIPSASLSDDNGKEYRCVVSNSTGSTTSSSAALTVTPDAEPPTLISLAGIGQEGLLVTFSEAVLSASATVNQNYVIEGAKVQSAQLAGSGNQVILHTTPLEFSRDYSLKVTGVQDLAGVPVAANTQGAFRPEPYYLASVGTTNSLGTVVAAGNGFDLTAGGREIAGKSDQFLFQWKLVGGNFDFQVRVDSLGLSDILAKGGLLAREDLTSTGRFAAILSTPSINGIVFQSRLQLNRDSTNTGNYPVNFPNTWLRLQREGNNFRGYASTDARNWSLVGSAVVVVPEFIYVGLAAVSRNANQTTVAKFRDYEDATGKPLGRPLESDREPPGPSSRRTGLVISEIMYHPSAYSEVEEEDPNLEFVEIFNSQPFFEDISGYKLTGDIEFEFPPKTTLAGGAYLVVAKSPLDVQAFYKLNSVFGPYSNNIPNDMGTIRLRNELGGIVQEVNYRTEMPWPIAADGAGHSIVLARPSFGEDEVRGWAASDLIGGSPGQFDGTGPEPLRGVVINEFLANPAEGQSEFIELHNHNASPVDLSGAWLSDSTTLDGIQIPPGTSIPGFGFISFATADLGFSISSSGESIYLVNPTKTRVIDAIRFKGSAKGTSQGRYPDGATGLVELSSPTSAGANRAPLLRDLVINEIMYAPVTGDSDDEFLELFNRGGNPISLAGWQVTGGIDFSFPSNAVIASQGYVVVAKNLNRLLANYSGLTPQNTFGNYSGSLGNSGDLIQLMMPELVVRTNSAGNLTTNTAHVVVDEVAYRDGGRWGKWSDGGGSSLELIDPTSDNRLPSNWADSDETKKSSWTNVEYTGRSDLGSMETPAMLQVFLQNPGEALLDNVEVSTALGKTNILRNPTFESGITNWVVQGTHEESTLETTEGFESNQSLHIRASSRGDNGGNRIRTSWSAAIPNNSITTIRAKVRWLAGTPHILLRLRGNFMECPGVMSLPKNLGTPGARNSRAVLNAGPAIYEVTHHPVLPDGGQSVVVTARVNDSDGIASVVARWRIDSAVTPGPYSEISLKDDGTGGDEIAGDGISSATLPGQPTGTMIAYYLVAADAAANPASSNFPDDAPKRECLIRFGETQTAGNLGNYRIWCTQATVTRWRARGKQSNHPLDCTFVYNDYRVVYNASTLYSGSPWHTPGYGGPAGPDPVCDYVLRTPTDDRVLGSTDFVLASIGNTDNDPTKLAEQSSYWLARKMGIPYNHRRFFVMYFNGVRRASSVYEDTQQPSAEVVDQYHSDDSGGPFHKIEDWFEFDDSGDNKSGNVDATLENFISIDGKKTARYRVCWRPRSITAGESPNDFSELFKAVDALNSVGPEPYNSAIFDIIDVQRWLSVFAMHHLVGNWDSYGYNRGKNMYAYKPTRGKWELFLWDIDFDLGSGGDGPTTDLFGTNEPVINRLYGSPLFRRLYLRVCQEAAEGPLRKENFDPLLDAKYKALVDNGAQPSPITSIKQFAADRRAYVLNTVLPKTDFLLYTTNLITTNVNFITLTGAAPVNVDSIVVNDEKLSLSWTSVGGRPIYWTAKVPLKSGTNVLNIQGLDRFGSVVSNGVKNVTALFTGSDPNPAGTVVINEISYSPADPSAGYLEVYNRSASDAFSLSGWRLSGVDYDFPEGSVIAPGQYLVIAKDQFAFGSKFGFRTPVLGEFRGNLDPEGETLSLLRPGAATNEFILVDRVRYESNDPWPQTPASVGVSLELIDASQDNSRVSNWADDGDGWRFVSTQGKAAGTNLFVYLTSVGDVYLDNLSLVAGDNPGSGENLLANGDFEQSLAGTWQVGTNHKGSSISTDVVFAGNSSLHLVATGNGSSATNSSLSQLGLPVTLGSPYTLSYWIHYGAQGSNVILRLNPGNTIGSTQQVTRVMGTPGQPNNQVATLPSYPDLWLNEVGPFNSSGTVDPQGEHDPWVEIYNAGNTAVDFKDFYLSDSYTNLTAWAFPAGGKIEPGELKIVWLDGDADDTSASSWHASFRIQPTQGSVALSRLIDGHPQIVDYLNYDGLKADESYGSFPDGQPFNRQVFVFATPGATNNGASKPLEVKINEWMASNNGFILDSTDNPPSADDWFELYNPGRNAADLSGYYLTDDITRPSQFKIPDGTVIPPGGYLLVWADGNPGQNSTNSTDLHVSFALARAGEAIGLYASDGTAIDTVKFESQTNNISQGRLPDGGDTIVFFDQPTPRSANKLNGVNTAPVLAKVGDRTIDEKSRFTIQLSATDTEESSDQLVYTLASGAPAGATLTPQGLFRWRPNEAQGPGSYPVTFRVNDNGTPSLQATETITISVHEVNQPPVFSDLRTHYIKAGESFATATATDSDLPPQALSFRLGAGAPLGVAIDPVSGILSWQPTEAQAGQNYAVTVIATDNGVPNLTASYNYAIQVYGTAATVLVLVPSVDGGQVVIAWGSVSGQSYQVEYLDELPGTWKPLGSAVQASSTSSSVRDGIQPSGKRFYRVRAL